MSTTRILFVNGTPTKFDSFKNLNSGTSDEWATTIVDSPAEALSAMADGPFDVVVCEMLMSGMNGAGVAIPMGSVNLLVDDRYALDFSNAFDDVDDVSAVPDNEVPFVEDFTAGKAADLKSRVFSIEIGVAWPIK